MLFEPYKILSMSVGKTDSKPELKFFEWVGVALRPKVSLIYEEDRKEFYRDLEKLAEAGVRFELYCLDKNDSSVIKITPKDGEIVEEEVRVE